MGGNERDSYERMRMYVHHLGSDTIYCTEMIQEQYFQVQYCFFITEINHLNTTISQGNSDNIMRECTGLITDVSWHAEIN